MSAWGTTCKREQITAPAHLSHRAFIVKLHPGIYVGRAGAVVSVSNARPFDTVYDAHQAMKGYPSSGGYSVIPVTQGRTRN